MALTMGYMSELTPSDLDTLRDDHDDNHKIVIIDKDKPNQDKVVCQHSRHYANKWHALRLLVEDLTLIPELTTIANESMSCYHTATRSGGVQS